MTHFVKIDCRGSHFEMGRQQGRALKGSIREIIGIFLESDEYRRAMGNVVDPMRIIKFVGSLSAVAARLSPKDVPGQWKARVDGIAEGAGIEKAFARGAQVIETLLSLPAGMSQCTTVAVTSERSDGEGPILLKNYDVGEILKPTTFLRTSMPEHRLKSFEMFINVLAGSHTIMNEAGLCLSYNYGMVRTYPRPGMVPSYLLQYAAENFTETGQVVDWISAQTSTNGCLLTVMDRKSNLCVIEKAGRHTQIRYPRHGVTAATNHFLTDKMKVLNYDVKTVFGKRSPSSLSGISVQESNETRLKRAELLLNGKDGKHASKDKISVSRLMEVARDHDNKDRGDEKTICRHHPGMTTLGSLILVPREGKALVCSGNPCRGEFEEISPW